MIVDHSNYYPDTEFGFIQTWNADITVEVITGIGIVYSAEAALISSFYRVDIINDYQTTVKVDKYHTLKIT